MYGYPRSRSNRFPTTEGRCSQLRKDWGTGFCHEQMCRKRWRWRLAAKPGWSGLWTGGIWCGSAWVLWSERASSSSQDRKLTEPEDPPSSSLTDSLERPPCSLSFATPSSPSKSLLLVSKLVFFLHGRDIVMHPETNEPKFGIPTF